MIRKVIPFIIIFFFFVILKQILKARKTHARMSDTDKENMHNIDNLQPNHIFLHEERGSQSQKTKGKKKISLQAP